MTDIAVPIPAAPPTSIPAALPPVPAAARAPRLSLVARSAALRGARTFAQAFLAVLTAGPVLHLNAGVLKAGATAGFAGLLTLAQRLLDETAVPTIPAG